MFPGEIDPSIVSDSVEKVEKSTTSTVIVDRPISPSKIRKAKIEDADRRANIKTFARMLQICSVTMTVGHTCNLLNDDSLTWSQFYALNG